MTKQPAGKAALLVALTVVVGILIAIVMSRGEPPPPIPTPHVPPVTSNSITVELGDGNDVDITTRPDNTNPRIAITVNAQDKVQVIRPINMHQGLPVDISSLPPPNPGSALLQVKATTEQPVSGQGGSFRTACNFAHYLFDDSIVYPFQRGHSHLHVFFGNSDSTGDSTANSLATTGNSTCRGGVANRSSYWVPAMLDMRTKKPVHLPVLSVYYKAGDQSSSGSADGFRPPVVFSMLPAGLRMITGNPTQNVPLAYKTIDVAHRWSCYGPGAPSGYSYSMPNCPAGTELQGELNFPQCWDGVNLDSPDHKSHMHFGVFVKNIGDPKGGQHRECPASHPKVIPRIQFLTAFKVTETDQVKNWRLVTDVNLANPAGWTAHGDWRNGWLKDISDAWVKNCVAASRDCHSHLLGDGRMLVGPP